MAHSPQDQALTIITAQRADFDKALVDDQISFDRELGFAMQILQGSDYTMSAALKNPTALKNSIINVAAIGISLNPASKQAYLVPRKGTVCLDISYMGMMHLAQVCGAILWGQAVIVRSADTFELNGLDKLPTHKYNPFGTDRGEIVGAYVVVKTPDGDYLTHPMTIQAINDIMNRSESVKAGKSSPWKTDFEEMAKKTVVKQASKYWPRRERLDNAVHYLNTDGGEGLSIEKDITPEVDAETLKKREELQTMVDFATTRDDLVKLSTDIMAQCKLAKDSASWEYFQTIRNKRAEQISAGVV